MRGEQKQFDIILRVIIMVTMFASAYMAQVEAAQQQQQQQGIASNGDSEQAPTEA